MTDRQLAHNLVDVLEPNTLRRLVDEMSGLLSPSERAMLNAPIDDEPLDQDEEREIARRLQARNGGANISLEELVVEHGSTVSQLRADQTAQDQTSPK